MWVYGGMVTFQRQKKKDYIRQIIIHTTKEKNIYVILGIFIYLYDCGSTKKDLPLLNT